MPNKRIAIELTGVTPMLWNRFTDEAAQGATEGTRNATPEDRGSAREQAEKKIEYGLDGKTPVVPQPALLALIREGGRFFKVGRNKVTTQKNSLIPAAVEIEQVTADIIANEPWDVDTRPVRIPATGGRILCHRPCWHDWKVAFELELDTDLLSAKLLREIVDAAGKRIGLGSFRPDCKGPFGRFKVTSWKELD